MVYDCVGVLGHVGFPRKFPEEIFVGRLSEKATQPYTLHAAAIETPGRAEAPLNLSDSSCRRFVCEGMGPLRFRGSGSSWSVHWGYAVPDESVDTLRLNHLEPAQSVGSHYPRILENTTPGAFADVVPALWLVVQSKTSGVHHLDIGGSGSMLAAQQR